MAKNKHDLGASEVQEKVDEAEEQGFLGTSVDPEPNSAYSLESGPDSPQHVKDDRTRTVLPSAVQEG